MLYEQHLAIPLGLPVVKSAVPIGPSVQELDTDRIWRGGLAGYHKRLIGHGDQVEMKGGRKFVR